AADRERLPLADAGPKPILRRTRKGPEGERPEIAAPHPSGSAGTRRERVLPASFGRDVVRALNAIPATPIRRMPMNQDAKKTALRMIPYGIYVLTADDGQGNVAAATVNWVTQTAFDPPLVVVGV